MKREEQFVSELIGYIFAYPDDDYMTMECLCRKLVKHGLLDKADGYYQTHDICTNTHECVKDTHDKTENSSEIPNNCEYAENPSGDVWECGCFLDTYCEHQIYDRNPDGTINIVKCGYEPKTEPFDKDINVRSKTEPQTIRCPKCGRTDYIRDMEKDMGIKGSCYKYKCINCNTYIKDEQTERSE